MKKKLRKWLIFSAWLFISNISYGQMGPPRPPPHPHPELPIDGGLSLLLISGIAYGVYELKRKK